MKMRYVIVFMFLFVGFNVFSTVGPIQVGENMFQMLIRMANTEDIIEQKVCDIEETVNDTLDKACDIEIDVNTVITKVDNVNTTVNAINGKVDTAIADIGELEKCEPEPISAAGTISTSGPKCLTNDIAGGITISASRVRLNLNGYRINNGISAHITLSGVNDVVIEDGFLGASSGTGVDASGCSRVLVHNVTFNSMRATNFSNCNNIAVRNVLAQGDGTSVAFFLDNATSKCTISNSVATDFASGITANSGTRINVEWCKFYECTKGFDFAGCDKVTFKFCDILSATQRTTGIELTGIPGTMRRTIVDHCVVSGYQTGILLGGEDNIVKNSVFSNCVDGILSSGATTDHSIFGCTVHDCSGTGITGGVTDTVLNNLVFNCTTNFSGVTDPVEAAVGTGTGYWSNVSR